MYMCNQFNVRSTMEIRRAHLCDFFLVLLFYDIFMYKIMCCKSNISTTTTTLGKLSKKTFSEQYH